MKILAALLIIGIIAREIMHYFSAEIYMWWLDWDKRIENKIEELERLIKEEEE